MTQTTPGKLMITLDFEIGWGVWELERWRTRQPEGVYTRLRPALQSFMDFLGERDIALMWATVGAMITPVKPSDFDYLPDAARDHISRFMAEVDEPTRDGRDLFDMVMGCKAQQAFASHSFSHTRFDYPGLTQAMRTEDLKRSRAIMADAGVPVDRFVFPENIVRDWDAVAQSGITHARTPVKPVPGGRLKRIYAGQIATPPLAEPDEAGAGVAAQTGSMFFNWYGRGAALRRKLVNSRANRGLDAAVRTGGTLHVWLHPFNLSGTPGLSDDLTRFLSKAADLRDRGQLEFGGF